MAQGLSLLGVKSSHVGSRPLTEAEHDLQEVSQKRITTVADLEEEFKKFDIGDSPDISNTVRRAFKTLLRNSNIKGLEAQLKSHQETLEFLLAHESRYVN